MHTSHHIVQLKYTNFIYKLYRNKVGGDGRHAYPVHTEKLIQGLPLWLSGEESTCQCRFDPWVRKTPWRKEWQPTPVFLSGKLYGQRSLAGYSPWDHKGVGYNLATKQQQHFSFTFLHHKSSPRFLPGLLHTAHEKLMAKRQAVEKSEGKNLSHPQTGGLDTKQLQVASKNRARMMVRDELSQLPVPEMVL